MFYSLFFALGLLSAGLSPGSEEHLADTIGAVTVTADKGVVVSRTDTLSVRNSFTVSDILHLSSGMHVGDYGGFAGLKTVSLRGLGSPHTSVYIDGVRVGNVQSGQNDLGMMGIENYGNAVVDYAQNSISFNTMRPVFSDSPIAGNVNLSGGSFGTFMPSARLDFRLSDRVSLSANAAGVFSEGDYPCDDGTLRRNNDISQVRGGFDLFGLMDFGDYHLKAYLNAAERGTPGSVEWPSEDRQEDMNLFLQGMLRKRFSRLYTLKLSAKASYDDIFYASSWGDSRYGQTELQLNSSHSLRINKLWNISIAADMQWDGLRSTNYDAGRLTAFGALTASLRHDRISADVSLEYVGTFDIGEYSRNAVSPSLDLRVRLVEGLDFVAFGRRAYRVPTFNELYYVGYGNPELKPEDAWLSDMGIDFRRTFDSGFDIKARLDGFYNYLTDKIISSPSEDDPTIWLPYNIGKVRAAGLDLLAVTAYTAGEWRLELEARYSCQSAIDVTSGSYTYGQQIPYIARNSIVINTQVTWKGFGLSPRWIIRSGRYDGSGELPSWNTLDLNLSKSVSFGKDYKMTFRLAARNILDCRYELVAGYPMPGINYMAGMIFGF